MAEAFAYFGGIDFSGAREPLSNLWTAVGREESGKLRIVSLRPHAFRRDLAAFVAGGWRGAVGAEPGERILWGADFPFGLPARAAEKLCRGDWRALLAWVADRPADEVRDAVPDDLRGPRLTDAGALAPLDIRLYKQTTEGLRWLHELLEEHEISARPQAPVDGSETELIEVYPSGSAQELGLPRRRAPGRPGEARARAAALRTFATFAQPDAEAAAVTLEDAWDATVACVTAWLARDDLDQPSRASGHPREILEREGWIYRPPASL
ncbi:MAG TPA: DUF429 domain-containing protein [Longimicrobiaceae bacterium]|nr:DUF429 domain-containing protein [Longimicrobiaceae bacterium]